MCYGNLIKVDLMSLTLIDRKDPLKWKQISTSRLITNIITQNPSRCFVHLDAVFCHSADSHYKLEFPKSSVSEICFHFDTKGPFFQLQKLHRKKIKHDTFQWRGGGTLVLPVHFTPDETKIPCEGNDFGDLNLTNIFKAFWNLYFQNAKRRRYTQTLCQTSGWRSDGCGLRPTFSVSALILSHSLTLL